MKKSSVIGLGMLVGFLGVQTHASTVYEGFNYTAAAEVAGQGGGSNGWDGVWTTVASGASNMHEVNAGLSFGALEVTGGSAQRPANGGKSAMYRTISSDSQSALTNNGSTVWFSVLMNSKTADIYAVAGAISGTIAFGDASLQAGSDSTGNPTIASGGNAVGVGFDGNSSSYDTVRLQGICYTNGVGQADTDGGITVGVENTLMVVGKIEWATDVGTDTNDTVTLYNVSDPTAGVSEEDVFSSMSYDVDQSLFNIISIGDTQSSVIDEIRYGTSLEDVMPVGEVSSEVLWIDLAGDTQEGFQSGFSSVSGSAATNTYATDARTSSGSVDVMLEASTTLSLAVNRGTLTNGIPEGFTYADLYKDTISASGATAYLTLTLSGLTTNAVYKLTLYSLNPAYTTGTDDKEWSVTTGTPAPQTQSVNYTDTLVDNDTYAMEFVVTSTSNGVIAVQNTAGFNQSCINGFKLSTDLTLAAGDPSIISITSVGSDVFMIECALDGNAAENVSLVTTDSLMVQGWEYIAHSDDGVNPFIIANLDYSTASGSNVVIYVEGTNSAGFFGLE
jgi:hypothetical protein